MNCPAIDGLQRRVQGLAPLGQSILHGRRDGRIYLAGDKAVTLQLPQASVRFAIDSVAPEYPCNCLKKRDKTVSDPGSRKRLPWLPGRGAVGNDRAKKQDCCPAKTAILF